MAYYRIQFNLDVPKKRSESPLTSAELAVVDQKLIDSGVLEYIKDCGLSGVSTSDITTIVEFYPIPG